MRRGLAPGGGTGGRGNSQETRARNGHAAGGESANRDVVRCEDDETNCYPRRRGGRGWTGEFWGGGREGTRTR
jgi:hypothetical protein